MDARFRRSSLILVLVFVFGGALIMLSPGQTLASNHSETRLSGQYESNNGGTTIWLRLCGAGAKYRFRSVRVADGAVLWDRTYDTINGCLPFSYRAIIGARTGEQFRFHTMVLDAPISDAEFLKRARRDFCRVDNGATGAITCQRELVSSPGSDINEPSNNQTLRDAITVRGWYLDLAATENSGISEVHVHLIDGSSDRLIGAATYGISRPDVAAAYSDTRFTNSGYSLTFDTRAYANGPYTLRVSGHSTLSGNWSWNDRSIIIDNNQPPNTPSQTAPANAALLNTRTVTLSWQDTGDPDNAPRNYRDFYVEVWKSDNSWSTFRSWDTATTWTLTVPSDGAYAWRVRSGDGAAGSEWSPSWTFGANLPSWSPPNPPVLVGPAAGATVNTRALQLAWNDGGDPDNAPRSYRDFSAEIWKDDNSWRATFNWQTSLSWSISVPSDGAYSWRVRAGDGAYASAWATRSVTVNAAAVAQHSDTRLRGTAENGTTIFLKICGVGANYRFRSERLTGGGAILWDSTYGALNGCTADYRAIIRGAVGEQFRFYSTVMNGPLTDAAFLQQARRDSCTVMSLGTISCVRGDTPPPINPPQPSNEKILNVRYVDQVYVQRALEDGWWNHCGPASVAMLLNYEGKESRDVLYNRQATLDLVPLLKKDGRGATYWGMLQNTLRAKGLQIASNPNTTAAEMRASVLSGHPVIVGLRSIGHIVLIVGVKANGNFVIDDPFGGGFWWSGGNYSRRNDSPWVNGFPNPRTKGERAEYSYQQLAALGFTQIVRVTGGSSTVLSSGLVGSNGAVFTGDRVELRFPPSLVRFQAPAAGMVVTHTSQLTSTHAISGADSLLTAFDLAATDGSGLAIYQSSQPFTMHIALDPDVIDALSLTDGITAGAENGGSVPGAVGADGGTPLLDLRAWDASTQTWLSIPAMVDLANYRIEASVTRFTEYMVVVSYQHATYIPLISR